MIIGVDHRESPYLGRPQYRGQAVRCDRCSWSTEYVGVVFDNENIQDEDDIRDWVDGRQEEIGEYIPPMTPITHYFHKTSQKLFCLSCVDFILSVEKCRGWLDPRWLTSTVCDLALAIREQIPGPLAWVLAPTGLDIMPIMHDALLDAGCDDERILKAFWSKDELYARPILDAILLG